MGMICSTGKYANTARPKCVTPGCGKPAWNHHANSYCSACRGSASSSRGARASAGPAICIRPGCSKPTWNGHADEYCTKTCREEGLKNPTCLAPGCGKPTWNGFPDEYCSRVCHARSQVQGSQVAPAKFADIQNQFNSKWDHSNCGPPPAIHSIWYVADPKLVQKHEDYCEKIGDVKCHGQGTNPGNKQRRFHKAGIKCLRTFQGTPCKDKSCAVCGIIRQGFLLQKTGGAGQTYGKGIYSSPVPSYGLTWKGGRPSKWHTKVTFLCSVACGVPYTNSTKGPLPKGTHSRVAASTTGNPFDSELVVYNEAAIIPMYLILHD